VDDDDRVLLVHFQFPEWTLWATPGGESNRGESLEVAIRRELKEEVGLVDVELGPVIWERTHEFEFAEYSGQHEKFFLVHTSHGCHCTDVLEARTPGGASDGLSVVDGA